jgi:RNA polymerase sigma-70 factor (ECF subfamily)
VRRLNPDPAPLSAAGDRDELRAAYRRYGRYVGAIAADVEDAVQDVFLAAVKGMPPLSDDEAVKRWLAKVTVRISVRKLRRRRWLSIFQSIDHSVDEVVAPVTTPEERLLLGAVYRALDRASAKQRTAWVLRYLEGNDLATVGELLGCSLATAKRYIAAAQLLVDKTVGEGT